jgi:hypothetical protein
MMKHELIERTAHEWVSGNPARGARAVQRFGGPSPFHAGQTAEEIAEMLIQIAGKMELAETRAW